MQTTDSTGRGLQCNHCRWRAEDETKPLFSRLVKSADEAYGLFKLHNYNQNVFNSHTVGLIKRWKKLYVEIASYPVFLYAGMAKWQSGLCQFTFSGSDFHAKKPDFRFHFIILVTSSY